MSERTLLERKAHALRLWNDRLAAILRGDAGVKLFQLPRAG
jgi:hypothetical protein